MQQQPFGEYLRQLRRQQGLTQGALGSPQFSKSYVSAVERGNIVPSRTALLHFADQLQQPIADFENLLLSAEQEDPSAAMSVSPSAAEKHEQELLALLDVLLKGSQQLPLELPEQLGTFLQTSSAMDAKQALQARLLFLHGLIQQNNGELLSARVTLERALALATTDYSPFICNALGTNYASERDYVSALHYHQRALTLLQADGHTDSDLLQQVEYRCGDDCRALGNHEQALLHFEAASRHIRASSNIAYAGKIYLGLGYCTYAAHFLRPHAASTPDEVERSYQLAVGYLVQSRMLYQVSNDLSGELYARLMQTMVLLDWSFWKYSLFAQEGKNTRLLGGAGILDEAAEQCQQVLLKLIEQYGGMATVPEEIREMATTCITYQMRVELQRAMQARISGYADTSTRERLLAICVCEWLLTFIESEQCSWEIIQRCARISGHDINYRVRSIASFNVLERARAALSDNAQLLMNVCLACGELAEEIALAEGQHVDELACFQLTDQCFQQALISVQHAVLGKALDSSYALRIYQRYIEVLELRMKHVPLSKELCSQLFSLVKDSFIHLPEIIMLPLMRSGLR